MGTQEAAEAVLSAGPRLTRLAAPQPVGLSTKLEEVRSCPDRDKPRRSLLLFCLGEPVKELCGCFQAFPWVFAKGLDLGRSQGRI